MSSWVDPGVIAASLSAFAAAAAAIATWRGPIAAARMAETLRQQSDSAYETKRIKLNILGELMQERAEISSEASVRALNLIDLAFSDSMKVRESWAELYQALNSTPYINHVVDERLRRLLKEMAADLGISATLRQDDFGRVYFPHSIAEDRNVRHLERRAALQRLTGNTTTELADSVDEDIADKWPPKP